ncbi:hypothetical protein [Hydrogenophaga sp. PBL-H3]|uniref:hypothetical protein n=1 Tax=Hydrogenophaga sp. PBL-H3 TaxID=434010 RepID=UPI00131FCF82|nr:hypothetical protein [Hydrogenophaga sp. PBL-H3]QHE75188.1 hypothetical protein F9Z45_03500 [Hydrogenophaga sp. PBL-H3]QHE79615.1 hypothetical protein F9Z44_03500 [Hydrogenophaga sp. PBL-H3]
MPEQRIAIGHASEIPPAWGAPRTASRRFTVAIREPRGTETFSVAWGELTADPGRDWVVMLDDGTAYPIKKDLFARTYEAAGPGRHRKVERSRLVQVPPDTVALLATLEGPLEVRHPDYVAVGAQGEVYANAATWVREHLTFDPISGA